MATRRVEGLLLKATFKRRALLNCFQAFVRRFRGHINIGQRGKATRSCHCTYGYITTFVRRGCGLSSIPFATLGHSFVSGCSLCLHARHHFTLKAVILLIAQLGAVIKRTVTRKVVATSPFTKCRTRRPRQRRGCLATTRLRQLVAAPLRSPGLCRVHSLFLFSYCANVPCKSVYHLAARSLRITRSNRM